MSKLSKNTALDVGPLLQIENLTINLPIGGDRPKAVSDVSFTVGPKEIVCVVGESGSGKSILSYSIMQLLPKTFQRPTGRIVLDGEDILAASAARVRALRGRSMAMIFQEPMTALNPVKTIGAQIDEVSAIHGVLGRSERRQRCLHALAEMRLPDPERVYRAYPHELSGGQRQRAMIAMALALRPRLLIADEPTTALDVTTQAQILAMIKDIQKSHDTGVLFITHDFGVVSEIADRVIVMQHGRAVEQGDVDDVLHRPQHDYTKSLLDAVPKAQFCPGPTTKGRTVLSANGVSKSYAGKGRSMSPVLNEVLLTVRQGETLGIVGESGSGKSTLARCLARIVQPDAGVINVDGTDIAMLSQRAIFPHRRKVQMVFQDPYRTLNPRRRIGASLVEGALNFGMNKTTALDRAVELLELVGLSATAMDRYPHQFSGGQRQRIAFARALITEPSLLVADEPVSALDVRVQKQILELLATLQAKLGLAMVFITHDLRVAAQVCHRVAVLHKGRIVETGETKMLFESPCHPYTAALIGAIPGRKIV